MRIPAKYTPKFIEEMLKMKRFIIGFVAGAMIFSSFAFSANYIAQTPTFKVMVNGQEFVSNPSALVVEGKTYLPLRAIGDALGVPVSWDPVNRLAIVGRTKTEFAADKDVLTNDKWKMTFIDCNTYKQISNFTKAADGKEFVVATFELENITSEKQTFSVLYLSTYFDDYKTPLAVFGEQVEGATLLGATELDPGKKIRGYLSYEVSPNWNKIDIIYNDDLLDETTKNELKFTIE